MGRKANLSNFLIVIFFILLSLVFYYPIFLGKLPINGNLLISFLLPWRQNLPFKFIGVDEIREFFPLFSFTFENLRLGILPFWNPYNFSGYPHLANWASSVFYPLNLFFFIFNNEQSYIFLKFSAIVLAGIFTYFYLNLLKIDKRVSLFGATAFSFSSVMLVWEAEIWQSAHTFLWLPLILFSLEKMLFEKKRRFLILGAFGLAFSVMAGYTQTTLYVYLFSFTYGLFRLFFERSEKFPIFINLCLMFVLSLGLSAIHTLPALEFFLLSPRQQIFLTQVNLDFLLPFRQIITLFVPDFFGHVATGNWFAQRPGQYYEQMIYIGVVPLVLSCLAILNKKLRPLVVFFFLWGVLAFSLVFNWLPARLVYDLHLPYLSSALAIRIVFIASFSFSILSAFGLSWWLENKNNFKKMLPVLLPISLIYLAIGLYLFLALKQRLIINGFPADWFLISLRNYLLPGTIAISTILLLLLGNIFSKTKKVIYFLLMILLIIHSFIFAQKYLAFSSRENLYPNNPVFDYLVKNLGYNRFWGYGEARIENNLATYYHISSVEGYDPVNLKRYNELLSSNGKGEFTGIASRSDALIDNTDLSPLEDTNANRLKLLDLLGVKLVVYKMKNNEEKIYENERFKPVWQEDGFVIFENKKAYNRVFLVSQALYSGSTRETIRKFYDPGIDLAKMVILENKTSLELNKKVPIGKVKIISYSANKIVIETETNVSQFLVLTDSYYPAWRATVDGAETKIYPADHALRAIIIPEGQHRVVFEYNSKTFKLGALISIISLIAAGIFILRDLCYRHPELVPPQRDPPPAGGVISGSITDAEMNSA